MNKILKKENIFLNQELYSKNEIFNFVFKVFFNNNSITKEYLDSMIKRDQLSSVALGNYLLLPHGDSDSEKHILKNDVCIVHLKNELKWDNQIVKIIFALALKGDSQMEFIQLAGISFSDENKVKELVYNPNINKEEIINFLRNVQK
ncbi:PTS sugar transporter subunit IIA [Mesomycoplasma hyorhinis]|uniref:Mannitol-specific phosphotransferase enzyme IIA component n=1 Tax=Mesomycoplasma hyorhinis TaxID=2100 RepID=A0ABD6IEH0_MESHY|nr:PTS sugar transporter subunit IIA [Mesomycoplasma hyorhinis]MXR08279.1 PTS mannitol transporter subunit IIABC [Mesomycoplasma hyorhinis]MXR09778.1 PTS mannitol transporter subunit IIABC [Mesomycoplasma hyorhinis]MXR11875.1 PTS mannitol transporter subunit IIABC [Mesomycoplasma hyorhinis]MXR39047.1 PTS mannitol transporter subunit IIABC [Mesomycoplasma hyorhinis]MXR43994.1 PTS mannitol transporter subunit IIABC [Mesomycoplasma hyorhinis]